MNAQQLKNSILQMAVRGKLVPQDPSDEPASVLLRRIREEKAAMVKAGKIKKEKNPSVIFRGEDNLFYEQVGNGKPVCIADELPFEIPESWEWVRLGFICQLRDGEKASDRKLPILSARFLRGKEENVIASSGKFVPKGTKIILVDGENSGEVFKAPLDGYLGSTFKVMWASQTVAEEYLQYFLLLHKDALKNSKKGAAIPHLNKDIFFNLFVPFPPLNEQRRIVTMIQRLLPYVEKYNIAETATSKLNASFPTQLKKSILQQAVQGKLVPQDPSDEPASVLLKRIRKEKERLIKEGKIKRDKHESIIYRRDNSHYEMVDGAERCIDEEIPFEIPKSWEWCRLGTIFTLQAGKNIPASEIKENSQSGLYSCYGGNGIRGFVNKSNHIGDYPIIGRQGALCGNINRATGEFYATEHAVCVDTFCNTDVTWACFFLEALNLNQYATATAQPGLAVSNINTVFIPIPPLSEQHRIKNKIEELLHVIKTL